MRAKRTALNFLSTTGLTVVVTVAGFVATPLLIDWLGAEKFGAFRAAQDWLGHLMIIELGIGGALLPTLAQAVLKGRDNVKAVLTAGTWAYVRVAVRAGVVGAILLLSITRLIPVSGETASDLRVGFAIGLAALLVLPLTPFRLLMESRQRGYIVNFITAGQNLLIIGLALWFASEGLGITGQFTANLVGVLTFSLVLAAMGFKYVVGPSTDSRDAANAIKSLSGPNFVVSICGRLMYTIDNIVVTLFLGPIALVPFFLTQRLANVALTQLQAVGNAAWAALAEIHFQGHKDLFVERLLELTKIVGVLAGALLVPIAAYNPQFIELWVGSENYAGQAITILASLNAAFLALASLWGWAATGTGHINLLVLPSIAATAINLGLTLALVPAIGPVGALIGTTTGHLLVNVWRLPIIIDSAFGKFSGTVFRFLAALGAMCAIYFVVLYKLSSSVGALSWVGLLLHLAGSALLFLGIAWFLLFTTADRERARTLLKGARGSA